MATKRNPHVCIIRNCGRPIRMRGLCNGCYTAARKCIRLKLATERQLEKFKLMLPARTRVRGPFMVAFDAAISKAMRAAKRGSKHTG